MKITIPENEFYQRNWGDFVHKKALQELLKLVPSVEMEGIDDVSTIEDMYFHNNNIVVTWYDKAGNLQSHEYKISATSSVVPSISSNNTWVIDGVDTGVLAIGEPGPVGPTGPQGPEGPSGPAGPQGEPGPEGKRGADGPTGPQGDQGPIGPTGPQGDVGPAGEKGEDGVSYTPTIGENGNWYINGVDTNMPSRGPQGPKGDQGAKGDPGPSGNDGPKGDQGPKGDPGPAGSPNTPTINSDGYWIINGQSTSHSSKGADASQGVLSKDEMFEALLKTWGAPYSYTSVKPNFEVNATLIDGDLQTPVKFTSTSTSDIIINVAYDIVDDGTTKQILNIKGSMRGASTTHFNIAKTDNSQLTSIPNKCIFKIDEPLTNGKPTEIRNVVLAGMLTMGYVKFGEQTFVPVGTYRDETSIYVMLAQSERSVGTFSTDIKVVGGDDRQMVDCLIFSFVYLTIKTECDAAYDNYKSNGLVK